MMANQPKKQSSKKNFYLFIFVVFTVVIVDAYVITSKLRGGTLYSGFSSYVSAVETEVLKLEAYIDIYLAAINIPGYRMEEVVEDIKDQSYVVARTIASMKVAEYGEVLEKNSSALGVYSDIESLWGAVDMDLLLFYSALTKDDTYLIHNRIDMNTTLLNDELTILAANLDSLAKRASESSFQSMIFILSLSFVLIIAAALYFMRTTLSPFAKILNSAEKIIDGDLRERFDITAQGEAGMVAVALNKVLDSVVETPKGTMDIIKESEVRHITEGHMKALNSLITLAGRSASEYEFYNAAIDETINATGAFAGAVYMVNFENLELKVSKGFKGTFFGDAAVLPVEDRLSVGSLDDSIQVYSEVSLFPGSEYREILKRHRAKSMISVPILRGDTVIGYFDVAFSDEGTHDNHRDFVTAIGLSIGVVVGYTGLFLEAHGARRFLERVFDQQPIGMAILDRSGKCVSANREFKKVVGCSPEEDVVGRYDYKKDRNLAGAGFADSIRKGFDGFVDEVIADYDPAEVNGLAFFGLPKKVRIRSLPLYDTSGNITNVMVTFIDAGTEGAK